MNENIKYMNVGLPDDIRLQQNIGNFQEAIRLIDLRLADPTTPECLRKAMTVYREIFRQIPEQYPYTETEIFAQLRQQVPDVTQEEFQQLLDKRYMRWIFVNGERRFLNRTVASVLVSSRELSQRAINRRKAPEVAPLDAAIAKMKQTGSQSCRIRICATAKLKEDQFIPGMFLRVHLPIPADCPQQSDIRIENMYPDCGMIAPADAAQRTVCWEGNFQENPEFSVEYSYVHTALYKDAYNGSGIPGEYDFDVVEQAPHVVFTPYIRQLCRELTEGLTDPLAKARAFYDFITKNMHYTYMPDYFMLENIAESCGKNYNGDCGVFALLFITLCRCAGIPAQWQSCMAAGPDDAGCHDWARFYVEPYGWLYCDPSFGVGSTRLGKEERRQFYFGNLEAYRMVANREFQAEFTVPKKWWRHDPYDNQTGEMETEDRGFLGKEYSRSQVLISCEEIEK